MAIPDHDLEISFYRSGGPGGQKKNTTDSAVRVRHIPTGITVVATASRSQHRNREAALEELERRLAERNRPRKRRVATATPKGVKRRRLDDKKKRSTTKAMRKAPGGAD